MRRSLALALVLLSASGCGVLSDILRGRETGSAELKRFTSEKELEDYFLDQITTRNMRVDDLGFSRGALGEVTADATGDGSGGASSDSAPPPGSIETVDASSSDQDFSQTTIQEEGVDEPDLVKTDGTYLYIMDQSTLKIVLASPPEELALLSEVALEGFGREIYLHDDKVVALTQSGGGYFFVAGGGIAIDPLPIAEAPVRSDIAVDSGFDGEVGIATSDVAVVEPGFDGISGEFQFERPRTIVTVVDVSAPDAPVILSETRFDGSQSSSRMIDGVLHLVISNFQSYYLDVLPALGTSDLDVASVDVAALLPSFARVDGDGNESSGNIVTWRELYRPTDPDGFGVLTVVSLDVDNDALFSAVGVVAEPGLIYSSLEALYLTDTEYDFARQVRETTDIYKLAYVDRGATPVATGTVPGRILNQYSMGEHQGHLRVATTVGPTFTFFEALTGPSNNVYVLGQAGETLETVGRLEGLAPGETIQSARFVGDRGYLVTFEQIDPFFTLDLADPTDPRVVGQLKIPGFSTFLVPIDADHLLAVGQYVPEEGPFFPRGVQLSIFDVSNFAEPARIANVVLGQDSGASSEAVFNPKAFTYFRERGLVALPVSIFADIFFFDDVGSVDGGVAVDTTDQQAPPPDELIEPIEPINADEPIESIEPFVPQGFEGLVVYSVSIEDGFTELGRINSRFEDAGFFWSRQAAPRAFTRGVFMGDHVFAVTDHGVRGSLVSDIAAAPYELLIDPVATVDENDLTTIEPAPAVSRPGR